jgi:hypothetical protein
MFVYVGVDEAGYGPRFGPLVVGRATLVIPNLPAFPESDPPRLWQRLSKAVSRSVGGAKGRLVVADSKKVKTKAAGIRHLERSCLAFAGLAGITAADTAGWLDAMGCDWHGVAECPAWYAANADRPWQPLPSESTPGELAIDRNVLQGTCRRIGVTCPELAAAVVHERSFNHRLTATRSKAAVSFEHVARHLHDAWQTHGEAHPLVVVDRQGGRTDYRELLAMTVPDAEVAVVEQSPERARYELRRGSRKMHVCFETEAEDRHMPVALASMVSKYTRELLMHRLNAYFTHAIAGLAPSAGYGVDGNRFLSEVESHLPRLGLDMGHLRRDA